MSDGGDESLPLYLLSMATTASPSTIPVVLWLSCVFGVASGLRAEAKPRGRDCEQPETLPLTISHRQRCVGLVDDGLPLDPTSVQLSSPPRPGEEIRTSRRAPVCASPRRRCVDICEDLPFSLLPALEDLPPAVAATATGRRSRLPLKGEKLRRRSSVIDNGDVLISPADEGAVASSCMFARTAAEDSAQNR